MQEIEFSWPLFKFAELADPQARLLLDDQETLRVWRKTYVNDEHRKELWYRFYDGKAPSKLVIWLHWMRIAITYTWPSLMLAIVAKIAGGWAALFLAVPWFPFQAWLIFLFAIRTWETLVIAAAINLVKRE